MRSHEADHEAHSLREALDSIKKKHSFKSLVYSASASAVQSIVTAAYIRVLCAIKYIAIAIQIVLVNVIDNVVGDSTNVRRIQRVVLG